MENQPEQPVQEQAAVQAAALPEMQVPDLKPGGDYSNVGTYDPNFNEGRGGWKGGHTYEHIDGKNHVISRDKYAEKYGQEPYAADKPDDLKTPKPDPSRRPGAIGSVEIPKVGLGRDAEKRDKDGGSAKPEADKPAKENGWSGFEAPNPEGLVVEGYIGRDGKPIIEGDAFRKEIDMLVADGDKANFDKAVRALWSAARQEARRRGDQEIMRNVKSYIEASAATIYTSTLEGADGFSTFRSTESPEQGNADDELPEINPPRNDEDDIELPEINPPKEEKDPEKALKEAIDAVELPKEMQQKLNYARHNFVKLSAKRRASIFGGKRKLADAKAEYDSMRNQAGLWVVGELKKLGLDDERIKGFAKQGALLELGVVANAIRRSQIDDVGESGKIMSRFYGWWARQGGKGNHWGKVKKMVAMGAIGFVPGLGAGVAAAAILGPVFGGVAGGIMGKKIAGNLLSRRINKKANGKIIATAQAQRTFDEGARYINNSTGRLRAENVSSIFGAETDEINQRNKKRMAASVALGIAGGAVGAVVGDAVHDAVFDRGGNGSAEPAPGGGDTVVPPSSVPGTGEVPAGGGGDIVVPPSSVPSFAEGGGGGGAVEVPSVNPGQYEYPWDWAQQGLSAEDPGGLLHQLGDRAQAGGHTVEWHNTGNGNAYDDWVEIDGRSDADYVINILNQYRQNNELPTTA